MSTADHAETASMRRVTLSFDVPADVLTNYDDLGKPHGITVGSVAASLCHEHDPRHGYVHFTASEPTNTDPLADEILRLVIEAAATDMEYALNCDEIYVGDLITIRNSLQDALQERQ